MNITMKIKSMLPNANLIVYDLILGPTIETKDHRVSLPTEVLDRNKEKWVSIIKNLIEDRGIEFVSAEELYDLEKLVSMVSRHVR